MDESTAEQWAVIGVETAQNQGRVAERVLGMLRSLGDMKARPAAAFGPVFHKLLDGGIYLAPSAFEVGFLSAAHTTAHVTQLSTALRGALLT